jgi:Fic family protein
MARIRVPKPFLQLLQEIDTQKLLPFLIKYKATDAQGRYLHWNDFKWRVERDDDELLAWVATKFARKALSKNLPLLQAEDIPAVSSPKNLCFSYCIPDSLLAQLHTIDQMIGGGREIDDDAFGSSHEKNRYLVKSLMQEEAITSSQLEGASTTREVAKEMLGKNLTPKDKSQQMILNNYLLLKKAVESKNQELSIEFILELHQIATSAAIENNATPGEIRKDNNIFIANSYNENVFHPPDWQTIEARLENLCDFANIDRNDRSNFIHPIVKAIILHFTISYIHPFGDGNGRTARAIFYWSMLRSGYWLFEYVSISKLIQEKRGAYDTAFIYTETDDFDLTYFLANQIDTIEKAVKYLYEYIGNKKRDFHEFMDWIDHSPIAKTLKRGHLEILKAAISAPGREFTSKQVAIDFGITENTARSYLKKLVDRDLLISSQSKGSRTVLYFSPANLKTRLKL